MQHTLPIDIPAQPLAALCEQYQVKELALFGSVLREDFRPESDIDLLVEFHPEAQFGLFTYFELQDKLADLLGRPVDLVSKKGLKSIIRDRVLGSSRIIYHAH